MGDRSKRGKVERSRSLALIEAALYAAGRPLNLKTLGSILRIGSKRRVRGLVRSLAETYSREEGALELVELDDGRFVLQLKPQYVPRVEGLVERSLLTPAPLKTLAYIAYRQPVEQSQVVAVRGKGAYGHVRELEELGLIRTEDSGKTKIIRTTGELADYLDLSHDPRRIKSRLASMFEASEDQREEGGVSP